MTNSQMTVDAFLNRFLPMIDDGFAMSLNGCGAEDFRRGIENAVREAFANGARLGQVIEAPDHCVDDSEREKAIYALKED